MLDRVPILQMLPEALRKLVIDSFVPVSASFGTEIVREGDEADAFYVIESGRARVLKAGPAGQEHRTTHREDEYAGSEILQPHERHHEGEQRHGRQQARPEAADPDTGVAAVGRQEHNHRQLREFRGLEAQAARHAARSEGPVLGCGRLESGRV